MEQLKGMNVWVILNKGTLKQRSFRGILSDECDIMYNLSIRKHNAPITLQFPAVKTAKLFSSGIQGMFITGDSFVIERYDIERYEI